MNVAAAGASTKQAIFIGDSLLAWFTKDGISSWKQYFTSNYNCLNLGVPGDSTDQTITRLTKLNLLDHPELSPPSVPKVATLLIGTNDIGRGRDPVYIANNIKNIIEILQDKLGPNLQILLLGIIPRGSLSTVPVRINEIISSYEDNDSNNIRYLDLTTSFCKISGGKMFLNSSLYWSDKLHLSAEGYKVWAKAMCPVFSAMMND